MFDIIYNIIGHVWDSSAMSSTQQQIIYYGCMVLIIILTVTFIDLFYRLFAHFWRK